MRTSPFLQHFLLKSPVYALIFAFGLLPFLWVVYVGLVQFNSTTVWDAYLTDKVIWTFFQAFLSALLCLIFGVPIAWILARVAIKYNTAILSWIMLPFLLPPIVIALALESIYGDQGLLAPLIAEVQWADTPFLLIYAHVMVNLPLVIHSTFLGFKQIPAQQLESAQCLGGNPMQIFWRIELPQIRPWLQSSFLLTFMLCFNSFGFALLLGGERFTTLEVEIFQRVAIEFDLYAASLIALLSSAVVFICAFCLFSIHPPLYEQGLHHVLLACRGRVKVFTLTSLSIGAMLFVFPIAYWVSQVFFLPLHMWQTVWTAEVGQALVNTFTLVLATLLICLALGLPFAYVNKQHKSMIIAFLPWLLSAIMIAFGLLMLYPQWAGSQWLLMVSYSVIAMPMVVHWLCHSQAQIPTDIVHASRSLGANAWDTWLYIELPLQSSAIRKVSCFVIACVMGEFAATLTLRNADFQTLNTLIYEKMRIPGAQSLAQISLLSALLFFITLVLFHILFRESTTATRHPHLQKLHFIVNPMNRT